METRDYWEDRYKGKGDSGSGSYGYRAEHKAEVINKFIKENDIESIIDFGCGDGHQASLLEIGKYTGVDISKEAVKICQEKYPENEYHVLGEKVGKAQLALSLDVIFHLKEEETFKDHMSELFEHATEYVIIYSSNTDKQLPSQAGHLRQWKFTTWVKENKPKWELIEKIKNKYPYSKYGGNGSISDFYIYKLQL